MQHPETIMHSTSPATATIGKSSSHETPALLWMSSLYSTNGNPNMLEMAEQNKEMEEPRTIIKSCTPSIIRVVPEIIGIENTMIPLFL